MLSRRFLHDCMMIFYIVEQLDDIRDGQLSDVTTAK